MKYLVLRKRPDIVDENPFTELASASGADDDSGGAAFPFDAETHRFDTEREIDDVRRDPSVEDAIPSIPFMLIEPRSDEPAGVAAAAQTAWGVEAVGATASPQTGNGVTVAVLDTGIDPAHPAFASLTFGEGDLMDFTNDELGVPGSAPDNDGHGTHVAATIFGREVDGTRVGVAPGVRKVLIGKVLGPRGAPTEVIFNGIQWALRRRADVICMSLGIDFPGVVRKLVQQEGLPEDIAASRALEAYRSNVRLFDRLAQLVDASAERGRGALLVAASGNESRRDRDPRFTVAVAPPAAADGFVSVGAVSQTGDAAAPFAVARFSNTGCRLSAPGVGILSAQRGGGLVAKNGTSMAAPHVAGVMALWTEKLFPGGNRPQGWAKDVMLAVESHLAPAPGQSRVDVGRGVVQAPR
ncbi:MAG TPA: S8 family serine peptidase [Pyrinomonadaceae bacterium]|nr:S8 family serine peptidase [Pyrinomonadaceae bacterium]